MNLSVDVLRHENGTVSGKIMIKRL